MANEQLGIVDALAARREQHAAIIAQMSPAARHAHLPGKYAKPVPYDAKPTSAELQELRQLRAENTKLKARISGLEARLDLLQIDQNPTRINSNGRIPRGEIDRAIGIICKHWETSPAALCSVSREQRFVRPRQAAYKMLVEEIHLSRNLVGKFFGRDHTTVMQGLWKTIELAADPVWSERYAAALAEFKEGAQ